MFDRGDICGARLNNIIMVEYKMLSLKTFSLLLGLYSYLSILSVGALQEMAECGIGIITLQ